MTGKERKLVKQRVLAKEKLRQFYSSYKFYIDGAIRFTDSDIRGKLKEIESLFTLGGDFRSPESRKKVFELPFSKGSYEGFLMMSRYTYHSTNKEFRNSMKNAKRLLERQSFRNVCIFNMMLEQLVDHLHAFENNCHIRDLCGVSGKIGENAKMFRNGRIREAKELIKELRQLIRLSRRDLFLNNIEDYIKAYVDFFVQCQFRLDKFVEGINIVLFEHKIGEELKRGELVDKKGEKISLELPGWEMASKFE